MLIQDERSREGITLLITRQVTARAKINEEGISRDALKRVKNASKGEKKMSMGRESGGKTLQNEMGITFLQFWCFIASFSRNVFTFLCLCHHLSLRVLPPRWSLLRVISYRWPFLSFISLRPSLHLLSFFVSSSVPLAFPLYAFLSLLYIINAVIGLLLLFIITRAIFCR